MRFNFSTRWVEKWASQPPGKESLDPFGKETVALTSGLHTVLKRGMFVPAGNRTPNLRASSPKRRHYTTPHECSRRVCVSCWDCTLAAALSGRLWEVHWLVLPPCGIASSFPPIFASVQSGRQSVRVRPGVKVVELCCACCGGPAVVLMFIYISSPNCDIIFLFISFKCLIELELEYSGLKDVRTFNSELTIIITIGIVVLAATSS